ncbi:MAG: hypothetical protein JWN76_1343 [Chitinophagaceae bacterium]|nr:hypothetical protein [Chitinophagaceae bacterium]
MKKHILLSLLVVFFYQHVSAQLCTGSLGDPVVKITFGNGTGAAAPLKTGVTNLNYTTGTCPNDGDYTITNSSSGCFGNTWHSVLTDHTGDSQGRFMLVNASFTPNDFYVDTVYGLCANTTYEFSTWVLNVLFPFACGGAGIKPNLTFRIETTNGTVLQKFDSGNIDPDAVNTWKQYGTFFRTPANISAVVIRLTNNAPGGCGNDLALDDITFRPCGPKIESLLNNSITQTLEMCETEKLSLNFSGTYSSGFTDPVLQWQQSTDGGINYTDITNAQSAAFIANPTKAGTYKYRVVIAERGTLNSVSCRIASNVTTIIVHPAPLKQSRSFIIGCISSDVQFNPATGNNYQYQWSGPNNFTSTIANPVIQNVSYKDSGLYTVLITTEFGCSNIDSFPVKVFPGIKAGITSSINNICEGSSVILEATGNGAVKYTWSPSTGLSNINIFNPVASPQDSITYKVIVTNQYGCTDSAFASVNTWKKPIVDAGPGKQILEGDSTILDGKLTGTAVNFYWSPSTSMMNSNTLTPVVSPANNTTYTLFATSPFGCGAVSDDVFVKVYKKIIAPNSFSPNGDGINDTWQIKGLDSYTNPTLKIFSRYGRLVYESRNYNSGWDGTYKGNPLPSGTYYYVIDLRLNITEISGWLLIVR